MFQIMITRAPTIDQRDMDFVYGEEETFQLAELSSRKEGREEEMEEERMEERQKLRSSNKSLSEEDNQVSPSYRIDLNIWEGSISLLVSKSVIF